MSTQAWNEPVCTVSLGSVKTVIEPRARDLGNFEVRRVLPSSAQRMVGPFVFFDEMGPAAFAPGVGMDVRPHPHIGLATITWLFDGEIMHRDSLGFIQPIQPGAVNWMTAGRGIVHSERTPPELRKNGFFMHGIQAWIALPEAEQEVAPAFEHYPANAIPHIERDGTRLAVIAGSAFGATSPVAVYSKLFYIHAEVAVGAAVPLPDDYTEKAIYIVSGSVEVDGESYGEHRMIVLEDGSSPTIIAGAASRLMLLGGEPLGKRHIWWNFVSTSRERIEQAKADWREMRFDAVPEESEFIPLPED